MYGLLHSTNRRLAHIPAAAAALRALFSTAAASAGIDDLVYVGEGYKICGKDEIEGEINRNTSKKRDEIQADGRKVLPPELQSRNVARLTCDSTAAGGICDVYLVGSNHNCPESWREVENVISFLKPQVVFLELCSRRLDKLTCEVKMPTMGEMFELWKNNEDPFSILSMWFHAKCFNQLKCSEHVEYSGGDFRVAYKEAMKYGSKVILGDRPTQITIRRLFATMSPWVFLFDPVSFVAVEVQELKGNGNDIDPYLVDEMVNKKFPGYAETMILERDRYMSVKILEVAREHNSVVAVVGKAHLAGIQKYWKQPVDMKEMQEILSIPVGNKIATMGKLLNTFGAMVTYLFLSPSQRNTFTAIMVANDLIFGRKFKF